MTSGNRIAGNSITAHELRFDNAYTLTLTAHNIRGVTSLGVSLDVSAGTILTVTPAVLDTSVQQGQSLTFTASVDGTWAHIGGLPLGRLTQNGRNATFAVDANATVGNRVQLRFTANNGQTADRFITVQRMAPNAPQTQNPTAIIHNSATLRWSTPTQGTPVTQYEVRWQRQGAPNTLRTENANTALTFVATGLAANTAYQFQVRARNVANWGPWSGWHNFTTAQEPIPTSIWNCDTNWAGFWNARNLNVWHNTRASAHTGVNFAGHMTNSQTQWGNAVNGMNFTSSNYANANIIAYAGTRTDFIDFARDFYGMNFQNNFAGYARFAPRISVGTANFGGANRNIFQFVNNSQSVMFVASTHADGTNRTSAQIRNTTLHEFGHVMGYAGHSSNSSDVMWRSATSIQTLTPRDIGHLRQVHAQFRP